MRRYNDYELIYMYKSESCEYALNILINKYKPLIYKTIYLCGAKSVDVDDYFQEGVIVLYKSLLNFNEVFNKTFTRYFELLLKRKIIHLQKQKPKYEIHENFSIYSSKPETAISVEGLNEFEEKVFKMYFVYNQTISFIASETKRSIKQIYNTIYRIKDKYKNNML